MNTHATQTTDATTTSIPTRTRRVPALALLVALGACLVAMPGRALAQSGTFAPSASRVEVEIGGLPDGPALFDARSFACGQTNATDPATASGAGGLNTVRPAFDDLLITKASDALSGKLAGYCAGGRRLSYMKVRTYRVDAETGSEILTLEVTASDVSISAYRTNMSSVLEPWTGPELMTAKYASVTWNYVEAGVSYRFDRRTNACTGC